MESKGLAKLWTGLFVLLILGELWYAPRSHLFWVYWELGTLVTAIIYTIVFYARLFYRGLHQGMPGKHMGNVILFLFFALLCMFSAATITLLTSVEWLPPTLPTLVTRFLSSHILTAVTTLAFLALAMAAFCGIDLTFARKHPDLSVRQEFARGFWFNGIPVCVAFVVLFLFVVQFSGTSSNHLQLRSFIGGAVAFEILTGNTVFVVLFWKPRDL